MKGIGWTANALSPRYGPPLGPSDPRINVRARCIGSSLALLQVHAVAQIKQLNTTWTSIAWGNDESLGNELFFLSAKLRLLACLRP